MPTTAKPITIGNVKIQPLLDVDARAPMTLLFPDVPKEAWEPYHEYFADDGITAVLSISSFVVRSGGKTVLVDTGIGAKDRPFFPNGRLPDALAEAGVRAEDVDIVLATHMHIDHIGWHTTRVGSELRPTFPNARHMFARAEWEYWTAPDVANAKGNEHIVDSALPLEGRAAIDLVDGEQAITDDLTLIPTPGHTPAHVSVGIVSEGEAGIIWGDVCHHPAQVTELWSPMFDMNPALARESRERLLQRIEDERRLVLAGHFAHPGVGRIVRVEGRRYWRAL